MARVGRNFVLVELVGGPRDGERVPVEEERSVVEFKADGGKRVHRYQKSVPRKGERGVEFLFEYRGIA